jgi:hypothetical protein
VCRPVDKGSFVKIALDPSEVMPHQGDHLRIEKILKRFWHGVGLSNRFTQQLSRGDHHRSGQHGRIEYSEFP